MKQSKVMLVSLSLAVSVGCTGQNEKETKEVKSETAPQVTQLQKTETKKIEDTWGFLPDVVVSVGTETVTKEQFIKDITQAMKMNRMMQGLQGDKLKSFAKNVAIQMVDRMVMTVLAEKSGYKGSPEMVLKNFDEMLKKIPAQQVEMFKKQLKSQGKTIESYREEVKNKKDAQAMLAIDNFVKEKIVPTIEVSDDKIQKFYDDNKTKYFLTKEKIKASHILITPEGAKRGDLSGVTDEAKKVAETKAKDLLKQLKNGANFAELAKANSACPSKAKGGSLGEFGRGQMDPTFEKVSLALKEDEISDVILTQFGYHIIKGGGVTASGSVPLDDKLKERIKQNLQQNLVQTKLASLIKTEKESLKIQNNLK